MYNSWFVYSESVYMVLLLQCCTAACMCYGVLTYHGDQDMQKETSVYVGSAPEGAPEGYKTNGFAFLWRHVWYVELSNGQHCIHFEVTGRWINEHAVMGAPATA